MTMLLEFLERHRVRHLFRSSHLKCTMYRVISPKPKLVVFCAGEGKQYPEKIKYIFLETMALS